MGGVRYGGSWVIGKRVMGQHMSHVTPMERAQKVRWPNFLLPSPSSGRGGEPLRRRGGGGWRAGHAL